MKTNVSGGIRVVGLTPDGRRVDAGRLAHGQHPHQALALARFCAESPWTASVLEDGALELGYRVTELSGIRLQDEAVRRDPGVGADEVGEPYQRVAAYAVVTSERGILLTQFTAQTHVAGDWGLPGGGLDDGESPADGVHREVWEETGQQVQLGDLLEIQSSHWIGRAPSGVLEDFHAVRIVYRATCPSPTDPVIHDVGGTTGDARWVRPEELAAYPLSVSWHHLPEIVYDRP